LEAFKDAVPFTITNINAVENETFRWSGVTLVVPMRHQTVLLLVYLLLRVIIEGRVLTRIVRVLLADLLVRDRENLPSKWRLLLLTIVL
jgi:hypothetical protein